APKAGSVACFSNTAPFLSLLAPGAFIDAGGYTMAGTSQATPHVAGALAVLRAAFPKDDAEQSVARVLRSNHTTTDPRTGRALPRLDLDAALAGADRGAVTAPAPAPVLDARVLVNGGAAATRDRAVSVLVVPQKAADVAAMCVAESAS